MWYNDSVIQSLHNTVNDTKWVTYTTFLILTVGRRTSPLRGGEAGHFQEVAGVSIVDIGGLSSR